MLSHALTKTCSFTRGVDLGVKTCSFTRSVDLHKSTRYHIHMHTNTNKNRQIHMLDTCIRKNLWNAQAALGWAARRHLGFSDWAKENQEKDAHLRKITDRGCLQSGQRHMFEVYLADSETRARGTKVREQDTTNQKNQHAAMQHPQTREIDLQKLIETETSIRQIHINAHCGTVILFMIQKFSSTWRHTYSILMDFEHTDDRFTSGSAHQKARWLTAKHIET